MNKYDHMLEAWAMEGNPFPSEAIHQGDEPYNPAVFSDEQEQFFKRLVYAAAMDRRGFGYLWSKGSGGEDTGFGKTTLLKNAAKMINVDFGASVLANAGMKAERAAKQCSVAAYASLSTTDVTGVYPILFAAVEYLADPKNTDSGISILDTLRAKLREAHGLAEDDLLGLKAALEAKRRELGATLPPLRSDALDAFCSGQDGDFAGFLGEVSPVSRTRNGLSYFDFAFTVAAAAGVNHFFVFVDQLEDLATNQTVTRAKRSKEVGRLRDIIAEMVPFVGRVHFVFTFHIRAAHALLDFWVQNRLPSFDAEDRVNEGSVVVLRGIQDVGQVRKLLVTYLNERREEGPSDELSPFTDDTLPILLERSGGRPGVLLAYAQKLFDRAADAERSEIDGGFASELLGVGGGSTFVTRRGAAAGKIQDARALDDLLR
jgi:hypothetical protein